MNAHVLLALGDLARVAAAEIADDPVELPVHAFVRSVRRGTPEAPGGERWVGILAAPLDPPGLLEREVIELLGRTGLALVDSHEGLRDWVARGGDPTVRVRRPPDHPGLPMVFTPFLVDTPAALDAVTTDDLFERALVSVSRTLFEVPDPQHHRPH